MSNHSQSFNGEHHHPPPDDFLLFVDGELTPKDSARLQSHLDACWHCRVGVATIEETIADIIKFEDTVSKYQITHTNFHWGDFDSKLNATAIEERQRSFRTRITDFWKQLGKFRFFGLTSHIALPAVAALVLVTIFYQFIVVPPISAAELLSRSMDAQNAQLTKKAQPVIHQRINVVKNGSSNETNAPVTWEIWNDTANSRVKVNAAPASETIDTLTAVLTANHMNEHWPLSAGSYKSWSDSLVNKTENVTRDIDGLTIETKPGTDPATGQITAARLSVRESDYHPTILDINVKTANGSEAYTLSEQEYEIVNLKDLDPSVFNDGTVLTAKTDPPAAVKTESPESSPVANTATMDLSAANTSNTVHATTADEVEVLDRLHKIGADITEQLTVTRTADGRLLVEGLVQTDNRKQEVLSTLAPVANKPAVRINIQTIDEATKALQRQKQQATTGTVELVEVEKGPLAVDSELRTYFAKQGGDTDSAIRSFASRVIARSQSAAFQASALNRMANRFTPAQLAELDPAARAKWLGILKGYAGSVRQETAALRSELQPVFGGFEAGGGESVTSDADLIASVRRLYQIASTNDRIVRAAFTLSRGGSTSAIKTAQFRRSVADAEALAAAIEGAR